MTEPTEPTEPTESTEPTGLFKLGKWLGGMIQRVVNLIIGIIVATVLVILGLAVAAAFIIVCSVIIAVIALFCALVVLCLPFSTFFGHTGGALLKSKMEETLNRTKAAAKAASNVHPLNP